METDKNLTEIELRYALKRLNTQETSSHHWIPLLGKLGGTYSMKATMPSSCQYS